ncbi:group II intron reverse transcriptase/maturase [Ectobacillus funiculus]
MPTRIFVLHKEYHYAKGGWTTLDTDQIITRFNSINRGIQNYYRFVDNFAKKLVGFNIY